MATIGSLAVKLTANANGFVGAMDESAKSAQKMQKSVEASANGASTAMAGAGADAKKLGSESEAAASTFGVSMADASSGAAAFGSAMTALVATAGLAAVAILAVAVGAIGAFLMQCAKTAVEANKTARSIGATTEGFTALQHAVKATGGDQDRLAQGLTNLSIALNDAANNGGAMNDVFKRLGLSAKELAGMAPDQAFAKVAAQIGAIKDPAKQAAAAVQIFGNEATNLLPLLAQGETGVQQFTEEAKKMGLAIKDQDATNLEQTAAAFQQVKDYITGIGMQIATKLGPYIQAVVEQFQSMGDGGWDATQMVTDGFKWVSKAVAFTIDAAYKLKKPFLEAATTGAEMANTILDAIKKVLEVASEVPGIGDQFKGALDTVKSAQGDLSTAIDHMKDELGKPLPPSAEAAVENFFNEIDKKAKQAAENFKKIRNAGGAVPMANNQADFFKQGLDVFNQAKSPLQTFQDELNKLNQLLAKGAISWDTYAKATANAVMNLDKALQTASVASPGALVKGSSAARSAIVKAQLKAERDSMSPQERIARLLKEAKEIEQKQLEYAKQVADALKQMQKDNKEKDRNGAVLNM
jgi:hypothetical protein